MDSIYVVAAFILVVISLMSLGAHFANQEKKRKEDKKKVTDFLRSLMLLFNDSGWRKNPASTNEETAKKVIEYFRSHHIETTFNLLMRDVSTFPKANKYRPMTNLANLVLLDQSFCMLAQLHVTYKNLSPKDRDEVQKEFFEKLELLVLDFIDPN